MTTTNVAGLSGLFVKNAASDAGKDFAPVASVFWAPYVIVTNTKVPAKSIKEFVEYARANPGKLNWAVVPNNAIHLDALDLIRAMGLKMAIVPYKGAAPAHLALLANEVQTYMAGGFFGFREAVQQGQVTILALASARPVAQLPGVPTLKAALGLDVDRKVNYGFATSPGTPKGTIDRLSRELGAIAMGELSDEVRKRGYEPEAMTADEFLQVMRDEYSRGKTIAESNGIKPQ
jgi:tripartite-type tricarboxylate transporter receptor subunit TctC